MQQVYFYVKAVLMYPRYRAGFLKNDLCGGGACSADQIRRGAAHLRTNAPAGNVDLLLGQHAFVKDGAVLLRSEEHTSELQSR